MMVGGRSSYWKCRLTSPKGKNWAEIHFCSSADIQGTLVFSKVLGHHATCFFGFDLDVVRAVEAPGMSDPSPMGLTAREVCEIADMAAADPRTRIIEVTDVNPDYDQDGITCKLAANIVMRAPARSA